MTQVTPIRDLKGYLEPEQVERLIGATTNPRDVLIVRTPWRRHQGQRANRHTDWGYQIGGQDVFGEGE